VNETVGNGFQLSVLHGYGGGVIDLITSVGGTPGVVKSGLIGLVTAKGGGKMLLDNL
jgi:hypothetical protein